MNSNTQSLRKRKCVKLLKKSYRKSDLPCRDKGNQEFPPQPQQQISKISSQRTEKTEKFIKGYRLTTHNKPNSSSLPQLITTSAHHYLSSSRFLWHKSTWGTGSAPPLDANWSEVTRAIFSWASKAIRDFFDFALLRWDINPENSRHFLNQSDSWLKPIAAWLLAFLCAPSCLLVFT